MNKLGFSRPIQVLRHRPIPVQGIIEQSNFIRSKNIPIYPKFIVNIILRFFVD